MRSCGDWTTSDLSDFIRGIDVVSGKGDALASITTQLSTFVGGHIVLIRHDVTASGWNTEFFHLAGASPAVNEAIRSAFMKMMASVPINHRFTTFNPLWVEVEKRNHLVVLDRASEAEASLPIMRQMGSLVGNARQSVMLSDGPLLLGSLAAYRKQSFTRKEQMVFRRVIEPLRRRIRVERQLANRACPPGIDAMLEAIEAPAFIMRRASIEHVNSAGIDWLKDGGVDFFDLVAAASAGVRSVSGTLVEQFELGVPGDCWGTLIIVRAAPAQRNARVERAVRLWSLSRRQAEVLTLVTDGLVNKDIATRLRVSLKTVEWHVGILLSKAKADNRAQLVTRYWRL